MPKNVELESAVISAMTEYLGERSGRHNIFLDLVGSRTTISRQDLLRSVTEVSLENNYMIAVSFREGAVVGYGYDFRREPVGDVPVSQLYYENLAQARENLSESVVFEKREGYFGVYVVRRAKQ